MLVAEILILLDLELLQDPTLRQRLSPEVYQDPKLLAGMEILTNVNILFAL